MEEKTEVNRVHFILVGIGILLCLVVLTVITFLDFRSDASLPPRCGPAMTVATNRVAGVCPACGTRGFAQCRRCGTGMLSNGTQGTYFCPRCQVTGSANCPRCGYGIQPPVPNQMATPVAFTRSCPFGGPRYYNRVAWPEVNANGNQPSGYICPNCNVRMYGIHSGVVNGDQFVPPNGGRQYNRMYSGRGQGF